MEMEIVTWQHGFSPKLKKKGSPIFGQKDICNETLFSVLEKLVVLLIQADGVLPPELLRLMHRAPLETSGLQLRAVLVKGADG